MKASEEERKYQEHHEQLIMDSLNFFASSYNDFHPEVEHLEDHHEDQEENQEEEAEMEALIPQPAVPEIPEAPKLALTEPLKEMATNQRKGMQFNKWLSLAVILMISICNQWQRFSLAYAFGFKADAKQESRYFQISEEYPLLKETYGMLSGIAFLVPYSIFGLFSGTLADMTKSRKNMLGLISIFWSSTIMLTGVIDSFPLLIVFRIIQGVLESVNNPLDYSLIQDLFSPEERVTANSILQTSIYMGNALSSLSILLISNYGWRNDFIITGMVGMSFGALAIALISEPRKHQYLTISEKQQLEHDRLYESLIAQKAKELSFESIIKKGKHMFSVPAQRYLLIGGSFRFFGGYVLGFFKPLFFQQMYPSYQAEFSIINALESSLLGIFSALLGGYLSDKLHKKTKRAKAYIALGSGLLAFPFCFFSFMTFDNFWFSIIMLGISILLSESWGAPVMTMLIETANPRDLGFTINTYLLFGTLAGSLSTYLMDKVEIYFKASENPQVYGQSITVILAISYLGSLPFLYLAGKAYEADLKKKERKA